MGRYEAAVIGAGGVGSAVLYQLGRRGIQVIGIDRFNPPHPYGSSHGQTRIIRQAHFEDPRYTPLMIKSYALWSELEQQTGCTLMSKVGLVQIGPPTGRVIAGIRQAADEHRKNLSELDGGEVEARWPLLRVPHGMVGLYESNAGYLFVEQCIEAHLTAARQLGAALLSDAEVLSWQAGSPISIKTTQGEIEADRMIVAAGPWSNHLLAGLDLGLELLRKSMLWYSVKKIQQQAMSRIPTFLYELDSGVFYGFPRLDQRGIKLAEHSGGTPIDDPLQINREVLAEEAIRIEDFIRRCLPGVLTERRDHMVCMYTMSPDEHFIVDRHPEFENVVFAAGLSGHGFKFAPVLGKALVDLSLDGETDLPIEFFRLSRFQ